LKNENITKYIRKCKFFRTTFANGFLKITVNKTQHQIFPNSFFIKNRYWIFFYFVFAPAPDVHPKPNFFSGLQNLMVYSLCKTINAGDERRSAVTKLYTLINHVWLVILTNVTCFMLSAGGRVISKRYGHMVLPNASGWMLPKEATTTLGHVVHVPFCLWSFSISGFRAPFLSEDTVDIYMQMHHMYYDSTSVRASPLLSIYDACTTFKKLPDTPSLISVSHDTV
jgi:hypothetical protein